MKPAGLSSLSLDQTQDPYVHEEIFPRQIRVTRAPSSFMRMGRTRTNRELAVSQVQKRSHSLEKDYQLFLIYICESMSVNYASVQAFTLSEIGKQITELITNQCVNPSQYIEIFPSSAKTIIGYNTSVLQAVLEASNGIRALSTQARVESLELMRVLRAAVKRLQNARHIYSDFHTSQTLSWWLPQLIEVMSILLLLSEPSESSDVQHSTTLVEQILRIYYTNLVVVIYFLIGGHLLDSFVHIKSFYPENTERDLHQIIDEQSKLIANSIRKRLSRTTPVNAQFINIGQSKASQSYYIPAASQTGERYTRTTWRTISSKIPHVCSACAYLFLISLPDDMRLHFSLDISTSSAKYQDASGVDKISAIGMTFENIRENWPITFSPDDKKFLLRLVVITKRDVAKHAELNDVPFTVPESFENWLLFLNVLDKFLDFLVCLINREAPLVQAENSIGEITVLTRFLSCLNKIELQEDNPF